MLALADAQLSVHIRPDLTDSDSKPALERRMQHGLFAYHRGDYTYALKDLEKACELAAAIGDHSQFVEACNYILRILAEREEFAKLDRIELKILNILNSANLDMKLKSRSMYVLGICSCYQEARHDHAMSRFRQAIDFAMISGNKESLAATLYGAATVLYARKRYDEALKELERLDILLSCLHLPDLTSASHLLRSMVLRNQRKTEEAIQSAWLAFDSLKHHPNLVLYLHTLCVLGTLLHQKGDDGSARLYLDLANRTLKREELPRIARLIDEALRESGRIDNDETDLTFDTRTGILIEKSKGEIRFDGQFILRDLLLAFLKNPGRVFTKQDLAEHVWHEPYAPEVHDNKIYVTIKRLRKLIENESRKSDYILRAKTGYFLNPKARVFIDDQMIEPTEPNSAKKSPSQEPK